MKNKGYTLVELVVFITLITISLASLTPLLFVLNNTRELDSNNKAVELAQQRIEIILQERRSSGFDTFIDPCVANPAPSICSIPNGYNVTSTITTGWLGNNDYKIIIATVTGKGGATLKLLVAKNLS